MASGWRRSCQRSRRDQQGAEVSGGSVWAPEVHSFMAYIEVFETSSMTQLVAVKFTVSQRHGGLWGIDLSYGWCQADTLLASSRRVVAVATREEM